MAPGDPRVRGYLLADDDVNGYFRLCYIHVQCPR